MLSQIPAKAIPLAEDATLVGLSPSQLKFVLDDSRFQCALTNRQSGKTHSLTRKLLRTALKYPGTNSLYLGLTQVAAKRVFWKRLKKEARAAGIEVSANEVDKTLTLPNGSTIYVSGAEVEADVDSFLGMVLKLIVLDESQSFPDFMMRFVTEILDPCLNTTMGSLVMTGTPNELCTGYFYDASTGTDDAWSRHFWLGSENPAAHQSEEDLDAIKKRNAWTEESPAFQRQYRGRWIPSDETLVYAYTVARNGWDGVLPKYSRPIHVLGMDFGSVDLSAFAVAVYGAESPNLYFREVAALTNPTIDDIAAVAKGLILKYKIDMICADAGALGKMIVESLRRKPHYINVVPAVKTEKLSAQRLMNSDFRLGRIKAIPGTPLTQQWGTLTLLPDGSENKRQRNDYCDAALYTYRHCKQFLFDPNAKEPVTDDYGTQRMKKLEKAQKDNLRQERRALGQLAPELSLGRKDYRR